MKILNNKNLYFSSDQHFFHKNIIKFAQRPFDNVTEMHETIINNWNNKIPHDGVVFLMGDFAFTSNIEKIQSVLYQLNGEIHLIFGNHCKQNKFERANVRNLFESTQDTLYLEVTDESIKGRGDRNKGEQGLFLCHYPMLTWNQAHRGSWNLFGHLHTTKTNYTGCEAYLLPMLQKNQLDVGVDLHNYTPLSYDEVKTIITERK